MKVHRTKEINIKVVEFREITLKENALYTSEKSRKRSQSLSLQSGTKTKGNPTVSRFGWLL